MTMNNFLALFDHLPPNFPLSLIRDCADRYDSAAYSCSESNYIGKHEAFYIQFWWRELYQCSELGAVSTKNFVTFYFVPRGYRVILLHPDYDYYLNNLALHCERVIASERTQITRSLDLEGADYLTIDDAGFAVIDSSTEQYQMFGGDTSLAVLLSMDYVLAFRRFCEQTHED